MINEAERIAFFKWLRTEWHAADHGRLPQGHFMSAAEAILDQLRDAFRLRRGASTWAELTVPTNALKAAKANEVKSAHRASEKSLMADLCAELDARKVAMQTTKETA